MSGMLDELDRILEQTADADDVLRRVVSLLVERNGAAWAGVAFLEDGTLTLGPVVGAPDPPRRASVPITFQDNPVGELVVDGAVDPAVLARVATAIAPYVLIGWDTDGEAWEP